LHSLICTMAVRDATALDQLGSDVFGDIAGNRKTDPGSGSARLWILSRQRRDADYVDRGMHLHSLGMETRWDDDLSDAAHDVAAAEASPLKVIAGPGTGKTLALSAGLPAVSRMGVSLSELAALGMVNANLQVLC